MKRLFFLLFLIIFCKPAFTNDVFFGVTGLAKVGNSCFLSILIEDKSNLDIKELGFSIYTLDKDNLLIGSAEINLFQINKFQPYTTGISIVMEKTELCSQIKNVNVYNNKCTIKKKQNYKCEKLIKVNQKYKEDHSIMTRVLTNPFYYDNTNNYYFIKEFNAYLNVINATYAKKYNIKENTNGLVVTQIKGSSIFKKGDLIIEAEMNGINNIKQLISQLNAVSINKKEYIIINFIRQNNKKLVAVKLK